MDLNLLEFALEKISEGVIITDTSGDIIYVNKAVEDYSGYYKEEIIGKHPSFFNADGFMEEMQKEIIHSLSNNIRKDFICKNKKKNGEEFLKKFNVYPLCNNDEDHSLFGYLSIEKDITEEDKLQNQLDTITKRYRAIFENAPDYINLVDKNGIIIDGNSRSEELLGYTREELIGCHYSKIIHPDYLLQAEKDMESLTQSVYLKKRIQEYKMIKKNGEEIFVNARTAFLADSDNKFLHTICFIIDIMDIKEFEKNMEKLTNDLQRSNKELEQFAYVASHDLQEPIRVISSYCQLLLDKCKHRCLKTDEEARRYFSYIIDSASRMQTLIRDLLEYSRLNRIDDMRENVDVNSIITEAMKDFHLKLEEKNAKILIDGTLPVIYGVKVRIKLLFYNLISNALKFIKPEVDPIVKISCREGPEKYIFCIEDNGIGIEKQYWENIFGLFRKLHSRDEYSGSGIGLAICKRIVSYHGGEIWLDSEKDKGSKFYFSIQKNIESENK